VIKLLTKGRQRGGGREALSSCVLWCAVPYLALDGVIMRECSRVLAYDDGNVEGRGGGVSVRIGGVREELGDHSHSRILKGKCEAGRARPQQRAGVECLALAPSCTATSWNKVGCLPPRLNSRGIRRMLGRKPDPKGDLDCRRPRHLSRKWPCQSPAAGEATSSIRLDDLTHERGNWTTWDLLTHV
jgi:hypothetical protein